jgi:hypothetical protein
LGSLERLTGGSNLKNGRETGGITKIPPVPQPLCTKAFRAKKGGCEGKIVKTLRVTKNTFGENLFLFGVLKITFGENLFREKRCESHSQVRFASHHNSYSE